MGMKIKCPDCKVEYEVKNPIDIQLHEEKEHDQITNPIGDYYLLRFKIHEKIRITEQIATQRNVDNLHVYTIHQVIQELKSLLENEK